MKNTKSKLIEVKDNLWINKDAVVAVSLYYNVSSLVHNWTVEIDFISGQKHTHCFKTKKDAEKCVEKLK